VTAVGVQGESTTTGAALRRALKLRSTWFAVGVVALSPPEDPKPLVYGGQTKLTGIARSVSAALERRLATERVWAEAGRVKVGAEGAFEVPVKPSLTTWYRLAAGALRTPQVRVAVAPRVRFYLPRSQASLRGFVRPVLPQALAEIQRLAAGSSWRTVARTRVDDGGNFVASIRLSKGSYRARVTPGRGFVPGTTRPLEVVTG
jgi:hypothetical protein